MPTRKHRKTGIKCRNDPKRTKYHREYYRKYRAKTNRRRKR